ncbi:hypothetical protein ACFQ3W_11440 [Paenibacillus puldeungensis]|uniref:Uncharacterized protein n=1 Tax=Paenibacillus puldeungensis TaxID=696536 RepID=A0ABW3RXI0_9BACL
MISANARNAIRAKLLESVPDLKEVYASLPPAEASTVKPFAVLAGSEDSGGSPWKGLRENVKVELYVSRSATGELDRLAKIMTDALDKGLLKPDGGEAWVSLYLGTSGQADAIDEARDAIKRELQFALLSPQPLTEPVQITSDPWLTALGAWSKSLLGPEWSAYSGAWPESGATPAVLWRITGIDVRTVGSAAYEVQKKMSAFFRAGDADREHAAILKLLEGMGRSVKIPLDATKRQFLRVSEPKMSLQADVLASAPSPQGPLTVTLIRRTMRPAEEAPLMKTIQYQSKMR